MIDPQLLFTKKYGEWAIAQGYSREEIKKQIFSIIEILDAIFLEQKVRKAVEEHPNEKYLVGEDIIIEEVDG